MKLGILFLIIGIAGFVGIGFLTNVITLTPQKIGIFDFETELVCPIGASGCTIIVLSNGEVISSSSFTEFIPWGLNSTTLESNNGIWDAEREEARKYSMKGQMPDESITDHNGQDNLPGSENTPSESFNQVANAEQTSSNDNSDEINVEKVDELYLILNEKEINEVKEQNEGCPVNFWKGIGEKSLKIGRDTVKAWPAGYSPNDKLSSASYFNQEIQISNGKDPTLQMALNAQGEGINKLARQSTAALLNAADPSIKYPLSIGEIISLTTGAIQNQDYSVAEKFTLYNGLGKSSVCEGSD